MDCTTDRKPECCPLGHKCPEYEWETCTLESCEQYIEIGNNYESCS
jgi:hypothetical protein